ncbi:MAG: hypothetical protein MJ051_00070 [Akkermansia sp.]|nr:hypothetical protein [Akkermansia sp.]
MKTTLFLLSLCAAVMAVPVAQAAQVAQNYDQAKSLVTEDGYILFIYGKGWDKKGDMQCRRLMADPAIQKAAGNAVMILAPLLQFPDDAAKAEMKAVAGDLVYPSASLKISYPAIVMYSKTNRRYAYICGPDVVKNDVKAIAARMEKHLKALRTQEALLAKAEGAQGGEKAKLLFEASHVQDAEGIDKILNEIKKADPEDKSGYVAAQEYNNGFQKDPDAAATLEEVLARLDKVIADPRYTAEQKQKTCAYAIGCIRRKGGYNQAELMQKYLDQMPKFGPDTLLTKTVPVIKRDWITGLQYAEGWNGGNMPMNDKPTELEGKLPIAAAGTYSIEFAPKGGRNKAVIKRVALYDGKKLIAEDKTEKTIADNADKVYKLTAPAAVKEPHLFISFGNKPTERDTRGEIIITAAQ